MKLKELKTRKYVALMMMIVVVGAIVGILKIGNMDFDKGKVKVSKAVINNVTSSLSANINEAAVDNLITSKGYDEIDYVIKYSLSTDENIKERDVIIEASLDDNEKYASFKDITNGDVTSTISENRKNIKITVKNAKVNKENELKLVMKLEGAPNGYKLTPKIKIKEVSEENYTNLNVQNVEVKNNSLTGNVQDEQSMNVSNIELALKKGGETIKKTYTDEDGNYVFSDIEEGEYNLEIDEDIYEKVSEEKVNISGSSKLNIIVKEVAPYKIELKKQITEMTIVNGGNTITYKYGNLDKVQQALRNVKNMTGEVKYKITVQNTGKKSGIVIVVKDEIPEGFTFNKDKNTSWEEKNGVLYNRSLEGITLNAGEKREEGLTLDIESTSEAKTYINKVTAKGEIYENIVYILDGKTYKEDTVLEGEKIKEPKVDNKNFKGWYTDKKYTNKYNFNNEVTKDLVLYGQTEDIKEYTVTYIDNEKIVKTEKVKENGSLNAPEVSKEGHTFKYWSEKPNGKEYDLNTKVTKDITLYSVYDINKYTVTFINGKEKYDEQQVEYGGNIKVPTSPSKEYYIFKYWSLEENGDSYDLSTKVTKDITLYSVYDINKYTVTFIDKGKEIDKQELEAGSLVIAPKVSMEGYTFKHWSEKENGKEYNLNLPITRNLTLYSVYEINKYNVEFYDNDRLIKTIKVDYDNTINSNEVPTVSKTGYTFTGWTENNKIFDFTTKIKENKKLYSKYEIIKNAVIFNDENRITTKKVDYNNKVEKIESQGKTGYTFKYWSLTQDGEKFDFNTLITEGITLYAVYDINEYSVNFIDQGNAYGDTQKVKYNNVTLKPETDPIKEGYTFKYWSLEENGTAYDFNTKITKDITLYSVYSINNYKVSFIDNEIKYIEDETIEYNKVAVKPETDPNKEGYTFRYWSLEENGTAYDFNTKITKDITLYSVYSVNSYKVLFINEGTKYIEDETIEYNKVAVKPETDPSKVGHTFKYWSLEENGTAYDFNTKITKDTTLYSVYEANEYTVKFMDGDNLFKQEQVKYGLKVNKPSENPTKEHNLFKTWTLNDKEYDFNLPVTDNIVLHSTYEEIEKPSISHVPTEWTNNKVTVTITSSHEDYKYLYKIDTGEYKEYTGPFDIDYNCTVVAKSVKKNVDSITESHDITNIDKIRPIINSLNEINVTGTSFDINVSTIDNESGMKQIHIYKDDLLETTIVYTENYNGEKNSTYTFNDLISGNDYKIKVIAEDVAGNLSDAKEITVTTELKIVARIIGRENKLFEDENLYENFSSLERAIKACPSNQCTIEMVTDTKESVEVLEGQDITLEINGKTITGVKDTYTINNGGNLIIKDSAEEAGSIVNSTGVALKNETTGVLTLGELEDELVVSTTKPYINGGTYGVVNEYIDKNTKGKFNFYDGMIAGNIAIEGEVNDKPYLYNASVVTSDNRQVATLKILEDAEARIIRTGVYYTKVNEAIEDTNKGTTEEVKTKTTLIEGFKSKINSGFTYDSETNTLSSGNGKVSISYTTIDLTGYEKNQYLYISGYKTNETSTSTILVKEEDENGNEIVESNNSKVTTTSNEFKYLLSKGKKYYVELKHTVTENISDDDRFILTNIYLQPINSIEVGKNTELTTVTSDSNYSFEYDKTTRTLKSNNQYQNGTTAFSYLEVDLTNATENKEVIINASLDTLYYGNYANIVINEDNSQLSSALSSALAYVSVNGYSSYNSQTYAGPYNYSKELEKGKKYYIQFYYFKSSYDNYSESDYKEHESKDQFIINKIDVVSKGDKEDIDLNTNLKTNYYGFDNYDSYYNSYSVQNNAPSGEKFDSYVKIDLTKSKTDQIVDLNLRLNNYSSIYITSNNKDSEKDLVINNNHNTLLSFYLNYDYYINGNSQWSSFYDYKYVLPKGSVYYVHFAGYNPDGRSGASIKSISLIPVTDNMINVGTLPYLKGTIDDSNKPADTNLSYVTNDGTKDANFRFVGKDTKNYVKFNNELWRAIGIFNTTDSEGNYAKRIKIVRNDSIGSNIVWDSSNSRVNSGNGVNEWSQSAVMKLLNPGYENNKVMHDSGSEIVTNNSLYWNKTSGSCLSSGGLSTSSCDFTSIGLSDSSKLMIDSVLWNTGAITNDTQNITPNQMYTYERGDKTGKTDFDASNYPTTDSVERTTTWFGKVGLPYPSDYIMASGNGLANDRSKCMNSNSSTYGDCSSNNNWMGVNVSAPLMTMSPVYGAAFPSFTAAMITSLYTMPAVNNYYVLKPSVYLSPKVKITSGSGTQDDPFIIELGKEDNTTLYYGLVPDLIKEDVKEEETEINEEPETIDYTYVKKAPSYGFTYDNEKGVFTNENKEIANTTAVSYIKMDLTNASNDMPVNINYSISSSGYSSMGFINLMKNDLTKINYNDSSSYSQNSLIATSRTSYSDTIPTTLEKGNIYYLQFAYKNSGSYTGSGGNVGSFEVSITYTNEEDKTNSYTRYDGITPTLNKESDTVQIIKDITLTNSMNIDIARSMILDLNGHTITTSSNDYVLKNNGDLTIIDSKYWNEINNTQNVYDNEYKASISKYNKKYDSYTINDYVQDGLEMNLDGIEHGDDSSTWIDSSGKGNNGTINGSASFEKNYLSFDGVDDYVDLGKQNYENMTIETVISNFSGTNKTILYNKYNGGYELRLTSSSRMQLSFYLDSSSSLKYFNSSFSKPTDKIYYAVTFDGEYARAYLNGILISSQPFSGKINYADSDNHLLLGTGKNGDKLRYLYNGNIYSTRIYNKALTEEEIIKNYKIDEKRYNITNQKFTSTISYGTVTSESGKNPYKVFDGNLETNWSSESQNESYIDYKMTTKKTIFGFKIYGNEASKYPKEVELLGSDDGINYNTILSKSLEPKGLNEYSEISISNDECDSYMYYRWKFKNDGNIISIGEIELYLNNIIRKKVETSSLSVSGTMSSTTNSVIYNGENANLNIEDGIFKLDKSGVYNVITNLGNLKTSKNTKLYANKSNNTAIYNDETGTIDVNSSYIYGYSYGIKNNSFNDIKINSDEISGAYGIYNKNSGNIDINVKNITSSNSGIYNEGNGNIKTEINKLSLSGSKAYGLYNGGNGNIDAIITTLTTSSSDSYGIYNNSIGNITLKNTNIDYAGNYGIYNKDNGEINLISSKITLTKPTSTSINYGIYNAGNGNINTESTNILISGSIDTSYKYYGIYMYNTGKLHLINTSIDGYQYGIYNNAGASINMESGTVTATNTGIYNRNGQVDIGVLDGATSKVSGTSIGIYTSNGIISVNNGTVSSDNIGIQSYCTGINGVSCSTYKIDINGGTISGKTGIDTSTSLNINDGEVKGITNGVYVSSKGTFKLLKGTVTASDAKGNGVYNYFGTAEITGGIIKTTGDDSNGVYSYGTTNVSNATIISTGNDSKGLYLSGGNLSVNSGSVEGSIGLYINGGNVVITGGQIKARDSFGIYSSGTNVGSSVTLGVKDKVVDTENPKIISNNSGIYCGNLLYLKYYDGVITGVKDNLINAIVSDYEEDYDINTRVNRENNYLTDMILEKPTLENFGEVAEVDGIKYPSVKLAFDSIPDSNNEIKEIKLLKNIQTIMNIGESNKNISINTNDKTIEYIGEKTYITNKNNLKIYSKNDNVIGITTNYSTIIDNSGSLETESNSRGYLNISSTYNRNTNYVIINNTGSNANINSGVSSSFASSTSYHKSIKNNGELNLKDSIITGEIDNENGSIISEGSSIESYNTYGIYNKNGTISISDTSISNSSANGVSLYNEKGNVTSINSKISSVGSKSKGAYNSGTFVMENGEIKGVLNGMYNQGTFTLNDGTVGLNSSTYGEAVDTNSVFNMYNGVITTANSKNSTAIFTNSGSTVNIYGGSIQSLGTNNTAIYVNAESAVNLGTKGDVDSDGNLIVSTSNPTIKSSMKGISVGRNSKSNGIFNFYDGIIIAPTAIDGAINEIEDGYNVKTDTDENNNEVKYLERNFVIKNLTTNEEFYSLNEAVENASNDDTLQFIQSINFLPNEKITEIIQGKTITIDINGKSVDSGNNLFIKNEGQLKIIDSANTLNEDKSVNYGNGKLSTTGSSLIENTGTLEIDSAVIAGNHNVGNIISNNDSGNLIIKNSKFDINLLHITTNGKDNFNGISNLSNGDITISNTEFYNSTTDGRTTGYSIYNGLGSIILENNKFYDDNSYGGGAIYNDNAAETKVKNSTILRGIYNSSSKDINIENCIFEGAYNGSNGNINITGGSVNVEDSDTYPDYIPIISNSGTGNINVDNLSVNTNGSKIASFYNASSGNININSGDIINLSNSVKNIYNKSSGTINIGESSNEKASSDMIKINGGIYNEADGIINIYYANIDKTQLQNISSGTINIGENSNEKASNDLINVPSDSSFTLTNASGIINVYYGTLINTEISNNGGSVNIYGGNITSKENINCIFNKSGTLDLYGGNITLNKTKDSSSNSIRNDDVANIKNATINGDILNNGKMNVLSSSIMASLANYGELTMVSGKINSSSSGILNYGTVNIKGGTVESTTSNGIYSYKGVINIGTKGDTDESGNIIVSKDQPIIKGKENGILFNGYSSYIYFYDGKIIGKKSFYYADNENPEEIYYNINDIEDDYSIVTTIDEDENEISSLEKVYSVRNLATNTDYYNLQNAIDEATSGDTIQFIKNTKYLTNQDTIIISSSKNIIIDINGKSIDSYNSVFIDNKGTLTITDSSENGKVVNHSSKDSSKLINNAGNLEIKNTNLSSDFVRGGVYAIYNSKGTLKINNGTISSTGTAIGNDDYGTITINGTNIIGNIGISNSSYNGVININDVNIEANYIGISNTSNAVVNFNSGIINVTDNYGIYVNGGSGTINIKDGTITSTQYAVYNHSSRTTINMGEKDGIVSITSPSLYGKDYAVFNEGIFNLYDGKLTGDTAPVSGTITDVEPGYKFSTSDDTVNNTKVGYLVVIGEDERVAMVNGINFTSLQTAINSVKDNTESNIVIYKDIELTEDIIVPENKIINLYLNGHTITYGDYSFVKNGTLTIIDSAPSESIGASIINTIEKVLNINQNGKNIIVYEMSDGSKLSTENTYNLYKKVDNEYKLLNMEKDEEVGRYITGSNNSEMTSIKGRIYLNNLEEGSYKLVSSDNKDIEFTITEDGKVNGNILENTNEKRKVIESALAYLIITIQTGVNQIKYIIYIVAMISIILVLYFAFKQQRKLSRKV